MPAKPKLRKKKIGKSVYWFTKAGGETYFGNVQDVPYDDARRLFAAHIKNLAEEGASSKSKTLTAGELIDLFLKWVQKHRSERTYSTRRTCCSRFASFRQGGKGGKLIADLPANRIKSSDMEAWLDHLAAQSLDPQTRRHAQTSVKHVWNWATKHPSPTPYLSPTYRPFSSVERAHVPAKALREGDLITDEEVQILLKAAEIDLDRFHKFGPKTPRAPEDNPYRGFADLPRCCYSTGARTDELAACRVGDVLFRTRQTRPSTLSRPACAAAWQRIRPSPRPLLPRRPCCTKRILPLKSDTNYRFSPILFTELPGSRFSNTKRPFRGAVCIRRAATARRPSAPPPA